VTPTSTATATPTATGVSLQIRKTAASSVAPGAILVYTINYSNVGGAVATNVVITETVPFHTTFNAAASTSGWSCPDGSPPGTTCTFSVPNLPPGAHGSVLFAVRVDNPAGATVLQNSVSIGSGQVVVTNGPVTTIIVIITPVPLLRPWGVGALLALLIGAAAIGLRRREPA